MSTSSVVNSWPRAIAHVDGDAFFASVEQAVKPWLKGKPVVTGKERNIVAAASYEAKKFGVRRGVALWEAKKMCPGLVVLPTDYETVSLYSKRMYDIMRRYTPAVEEYSVDEGFIDLTGLRRVHGGSYDFIARKLQQDIHRELGITVTVGLSVSKVLTKVASAKGKQSQGVGSPAGFVSISARDIDRALDGVPIEGVWNIGVNTAALLRSHGMTTALKFARRPESYISKLLTKPGMEVWRELNGEAVMAFETGRKESYQSISKVKTFTPPSKDSGYVSAQLMKNVDNACIKARRYNQAPKKITVFLKREDYRVSGLEVRLKRPSAYPKELGSVLRSLFDDLFQEGTFYRATGVILADLVAANPVQPTLFERPTDIAKTKRIYNAIDELRDKYGKHIVQSGSILPGREVQHQTERGDLPLRKSTLLKGETQRRRLPLPMFQTKAQ